MDIKKGDKIRVRRVGHTRFVRAFALEDGYGLRDWYVVRYAVRRRADNAMSGQDHYAIAGQDSIEMGW